MSNILVNNLYLWYNPDPEFENDIVFEYLSNGIFIATDLTRDNTDMEEFFNDATGPPYHFNVDTNGSQIIAIRLSQGVILYQQLQDGQFIELLDRPNLDNSYFEDIDILEVPLPNGREINEIRERLPLKQIDPSIVQELGNFMNDRPLDNEIYDEILSLLNPTNLEASSINHDLQIKSYETLIQQLYGLPVEIPEYLIINGLRTNFISF